MKQIILAVTQKCGRSDCMIAHGITSDVLSFQTLADRSRAGLARPMVTKTSTLKCLTCDKECILVQQGETAWVDGVAVAPP